MGAMKYTKEMKKFILDNYKGVSSKELARRFNDNFGCSVTERQMLCFKNTNKLNSGLTGNFEKGHTPANKGKKMSPEQYEKCKATMFKKGNTPHNHKQVGYERLDEDGYILTKVAEPNVFKHKHRVVWEKHYGAIPSGHVVIFLDGDRTNTDISNLEMISNSLNSVLNRKRLRSEDEQLTKAGIALGKLIQATSKAKRAQR